MKPMRLLRAAFLAVALVMTSLAVSTPALADHNPSPIDWTILDTYYDQWGRDMPLRIGQEDLSTVEGVKVKDGFGKLHIEQGHDAGVPPYEDIQDTIASRDYCRDGYLDIDDHYKYRCFNPQTTLFVVYSPDVDPRSGDDIPVGIITAFYTGIPNF
jgi:hypothetical protein